MLIHATRKSNTLHTEKAASINKKHNPSTDTPCIVMNIHFILLLLSSLIKQSPFWD